MGDLDDGGRPEDLEIPSDSELGRLVDDVILGVFKSFMSSSSAANGMSLDLVGVSSEAFLLLELPALPRLLVLSLLVVDNVDFGFGGDRVGDPITESTTVSSSSGSDAIGGATSSTSDTSFSVQSESLSVCCCFIIDTVHSSS